MLITHSTASTLADTRRQSTDALLWRRSRAAGTEEPSNRPTSRTSCTAHQHQPHAPASPISGSRFPQETLLSLFITLSWGQVSRQCIFQISRHPHRSSTISPNQSAFGVEFISHTHSARPPLDFSPYFHSRGFQTRQLVELCARYGKRGCPSGSPLQPNLSTRMATLFRPSQYHILRQMTEDRDARRFPAGPWSIANVHRSVIVVFELTLRQVYFPISTSFAFYCPCLELAHGRVC